MSLGLVAYDSSDGSENEEEPDQQSQVKIVNPQSSLPSTSKSSEVQALTTETEKNFHISDESDDESVAEINFSVVPLPKKPVEYDKEIEEADKLPLPKKVNYGDPLPEPPKKSKGPVKIFIPSLSEFKDEEDESTPNQVKKTPSQGSCLLLNLLPPPKSAVSTTKPTSMVPHVLTKKHEEPKSSTVQPKKLTPASISALKPSSSLSKPSSQHHSDSEDDDEVATTSGGDFFSLTTPIKVPDELIKPLSTEDLQEITAPSVANRALANVAQYKKEESPQEENQKTLTSNVMNLPREEILQKNKSEVGPKLPVPEQEYHMDEDGNIAFDEKAIEYLCGKRGVKRKEEFSNVDIVEISGEDMKPDEREWLVKALTEDPIHRPISMGAGPSGTSKKKHQITYLAHQAKAMEHELKNQWAQNKASRQQTRSKYGF